MAVETADDRAVFVNTDEFGITGTFTQIAGSPTIDGIFDASPSLAGEGMGLGVQSVDPTFLCRSADLPAAIADGSVLTIDGTAYYCRNRENDNGMTLIQLEEVRGA